MRTISADNSAILAGRPRIAHRIQVKDAGGTFRDLSTYPGVDLLEDLAWGETLDNPGVTWSATLTREQELISAAPFMSNSPLNRAFNPANSYAALLQIGRQMKVEYSMQAEDDPRSRSWSLAFEGYIGTVDSGGGDSVKLTGRGLEAAIDNAFAQRERVYAFAQGANADRGCYVWPDPTKGATYTTFAVGDRMIPSDSKQNGHFYRATSITTGISGATEPAWPTGGGSTVVDGGVTWTESGATSDTVGTAIETVMQQFLNDNLGIGTVTLVTPVSPGWAVVYFLITRQSPLAELKALADEIGWCIRYMVTGSSSELRFFDPNRANTTSMRSFGPTQVEDIVSLKTDWSAIRNKIRVVYSDAQTRDAGGNMTRKALVRSDSASIAKYGELFAEVAEASNSNIDSATESQALADAVLSDLAEPTADMQATLLFFFAFVEMCDLYTLTADGVHFDTDQKLAVSSFDHKISPGEQSTSIKLRGKPASNSAKGWAELLSDANGAEIHALTTHENSSAINLQADTASVGGARISFAWQGPKVPHDARFELHISTTPAFAVTSATKVQDGKEQSFEVGNLDPSQTYYAKVVPVIWNAQKQVRGSPSAEISFVPGRAQATHLESDVEWGRLPLNGGFETQFDPSKAPDFWFMEGGFFGVWGVNGFVLTDGSGISGAQYVKLISTTNLIGARINSAEFSVNELVEYQPSFWRKTISGAGTCTVRMEFFDQTHAPLTTVDETFSMSSSVGTWVKHTMAPFFPPSGSRFGIFTVWSPSGTSPFQELHIDDARFDQAPIGSTAPPMMFHFGESTLANGTRYMTPGFNYGGIPTQDIFVIAPCNGHLTELQVRMIDPMSSAGGATLTITVRTAAPITSAPSPTDSALVVAFTAGGQGGTYANGSSTGSVAVSKGDLISVKVLDTNYGTSTAKYVAQVLLAPA